MEEERKIMKLRINHKEKGFGDALGVNFERFKEITDTVYNRTKEGRIGENSKTKTLQLIVNDLDGVTPEELVFMGMSFGALEYMNKSGDEAERIIRDGKPEEIAAGALNKEVFVEHMKDGEHDF